MDKTGPKALHLVAAILLANGPAFAEAKDSAGAKPRAEAATDIKAGVDAWTRGDYAVAIGKWQGPAAQGDADAQFNLGQAYKLGRGVKQDLARAEELFGKAAAQGHLQASDNYGLLLFERGQRGPAMPYIRAAADRGDPRAQYLLGIAHFNGDLAPRDWVRAYALVSLAQQAGLQQAAAALAQMDQYIPLEQRQQAASLSDELARQAEATRARQLATADLGSGVASKPSQPGAAPVTASVPAHSSPAGPSPASTSPTGPTIAYAANAVAQAARDAGADYARPQGSAPASPTRHAGPPAATSGGSWRIQLGAFSVPTNAEDMWKRVKGRPELSGHGKFLIRAGSVTKLQAGGFASQADAQSACTRLSAAGFDCMALRN